MAKSYLERLRGLSHSSVLEEQDVLTIKRRLAAGETPRAIARDYLLSTETIRKINRGESWAWLTPEQPRDPLGEEALAKAAAESLARLEGKLKERQ